MALSVKSISECAEMKLRLAVEQEVIVKFRGTPGPWKVITTGKHWNNSDLENIQVQFGYAGECICDTVYVREDANLISAAPDLLNALINLIEYWKLDETAEAHAAMIAINKALGRE